MSKVLIVCIGNSLVGDDALGYKVYERLQTGSLLAGGRTVFLELSGMQILDFLNGDDLLVIVDAVQFGDPPGTVHVRDLADIPQAEGNPITSHHMGLREALSLGTLLYPEKMPRRTVLVGVEGLCFDQIGVPLTPQVEAAIDEVIVEIRNLILN
ncbi:hydrogenase maturation protease [candidate division CSSED10-310 bacterium]|uniref:Hydrogenase maturation protease n=1 Tax=candidate division CSSED10-310 bacterium TaxID=2855610 RepID=A0ABV6Z540_UNCC1